MPWLGPLEPCALGTLGDTCVLVALALGAHGPLGTHGPYGPFGPGAHGPPPPATRGSAPGTVSGRCPWKGFMMVPHFGAPLFLLLFCD